MTHYTSKGRPRGAAAVLLLAASALALSACGLSDPPKASGSSTPTTSVMAPKKKSSATSVVPLLPTSPFFAGHSAWRLSVRHAPLNSNSRAMVRNLAAQVSDRYNGEAAFNYYQYNTSFYRVPARMARADVVWDNCQHKGYTPSQLFSGPAYFKSVPIPENAVPASGSDAEISVWSPSTDQLWEFWKAHKVAGQWHACWGGRIDHVSTSPGYFPDGMGASATGLPVAAGSIGIREIKRGRIDHAMNLLVVNAATYSTYSYPAQRSDGYDPSHSADAIPEGIRFRLDPRVDVKKLHLTRIGKIVARAAQTYGFVVTDKGGAVAVQAESGTAWPTSRRANPWGRLLQGSHGYDVLRNFPWGRLQALPINYGKP